MGSGDRQPGVAAQPQATPRLLCASVSSVYKWGEIVPKLHTLGGCSECVSTQDVRGQRLAHGKYLIIIIHYASLRISKSTCSKVTTACGLV